MNNLLKEISEKKQNRKAILDLAGSWSDFTEKDFQEFLDVTKQVSKDIFNINGTYPHWRNLVRSDAYATHFREPPLSAVGEGH
ncbi:MAG: hypothetical protein HC912_05845 [Saprospiraceae bacterium]|nr:hypothetical protein [Saprospiraceae bacterium]